jgi:hypothetical protein
VVVGLGFQKELSATSIVAKIKDLDFGISRRPL